jgi:xylose isomerase
MTMKQKVSLEKKYRLNVNLFKSYVVIAAEIKEASQKKKKSDKLVHKIQNELKQSASQLLWNIN